MGMQRLCTLFAVSALLAAEPASACFPVMMKFEDVRYAHAVVIGTIQNFEIVEPKASKMASRDLRNLMADDPYSPDNPRFLDRKVGLFSRHAKFEINIGSVLAGGVPRKTLTVVSQKLAFRDPASMNGDSFLIALRSATLVGPGDDAETVPISIGYTILQATCSGAFIFKESSDQAREIREIVREQRLKPFQDEIGRLLPTLPPLKPD